MKTAKITTFIKFTLSAILIRSALSCSEDELLLTEADNAKAEFNLEYLNNLDNDIKDLSETRASRLMINANSSRSSQNSEIDADRLVALLEEENRSEEEAQEL
jgi:hypothetical protein